MIEGAFVDGGTRVVTVANKGMQSRPSSIEKTRKGNSETCSIESTDLPKESVVDTLWSIFRRVMANISSVA